MPLRELAADPILVADEIEVIRADRRKKGTRAGASAATSTARFIRTMFTFAQRRDPTLVGNPAAAVRSVDPKRHDLPILHRADMAEWWDKVSKVKNDVERWALVFALLSGLRRDSLVKLRWEDVRTPILKARALRVRSPKGGEERAFDLILHDPCLGC
jgi:site-specific recombinase XerD